jgi:cell division protein FtsB
MKFSTARLIVIFLSLFLSVFSYHGYAQSKNAISVDELLEKVKQGYRRDQQVNQQRREEFSLNQLISSSSVKMLSDLACNENSNLK